MADMENPSEAAWRAAIEQHVSAQPMDKEPDMAARIKVTPGKAEPALGRPTIGGAVHVRLGDERFAVDQWAASHDVTRAEAVRRLVRLALDSIEMLPCAYCGKEFEAVRVNGELQCLDARGVNTCDSCYDESTGYGFFDPKAVPES